MEFKNPCLCCLERPSDKDLMIPYTISGSTETKIYANMLKECFEIHLQKLSGDDSCGICEACVARLRDASDFKQQVLRSLSELRARLEGNSSVKGEVTKEESAEVKSEILGDNDDAECEEVQYEDSQDLLPENENEFMKDYESFTEEEVEYTKPVTKFTKKVQSVKSELVTNGVHASPTDNSTDLNVDQAVSCDSCGRHFKNKLSLLNHMRVHNKIKVYTCEICHSKFKRYKQLVAHKRVHKGEKPFSCPICNKKFRETASLIIHNKIHTGEKPFSCDICEKKFTLKNLLDSHKRNKHSIGAKTYVCSECNKGFSQKGNLIAHIRVHTGEKPYQCEVCKKQFNHQSSFNYHVRAHAKGKKMNFKYACQKCNKNFRSLFHFTCHERMHKGEKPYPCEECDSQFSRKDHLDRHKQRHKSFKRYCCELCGKQFSGMSNLNQHKVVHGLGERRIRTKRSRRGAPPTNSGQAFTTTDKLKSSKRDVASVTKKKSV